MLQPSATSFAYLVIASGGLIASIAFNGNGIPSKVHLA